MSINLSRRNLLQGFALAGACSLVSWPRLLWADVPTDKRLLVIVLRGAMDGLGAVPAIGDPDYQQARGGLAFKDKGLLPLNNTFALNGALQPFHQLYQSRELVVLHATATPYRERSHFDAQDLLENGSTQPHYLKTGWLGRTVDSMGGTSRSIAIGPTVPLILQGNQMAESWSPGILPQADPDFMTRVAHMYKSDPLLSRTINSTLQTAAVNDKKNTDDNKRQLQFLTMMKTTAQFMAKSDGPRIATIDLDGWDTHSGQGLDEGRLGQALRTLADGTTTFKEGMGPLWSQTAVLVVTEFGRTVMSNGTGGSDHGTGSAAFLIGGKVNGGQVIGDWPGLAKAKLYQERDLYPANDLRCLLKATLKDHMRVPDNQIEQTIFPASAQAIAYKNLFLA